MSDGANQFAHIGSPPEKNIGTPPPQPVTRGYMRALYPLLQGHIQCYTGCRLQPPLPLSGTSHHIIPFRESRLTTMCAQTPLLSSLMTPESHLCTALVPRGDDGLPLHDLSRILELLQCECKHQFLPDSIPCRQYFSWTINLFSWHLSRFLGQQPLRLMWPRVIMLILYLQACGSMCRRSGKTVGGSGQPPRIGEEIPTNWRNQLADRFFSKTGSCSLISVPGPKHTFFLVAL